MTCWLSSHKCNLVSFHCGNGFLLTESQNSWSWKGIIWSLLKQYLKYFALDLLESGFEYLQDGNSKTCLGDLFLCLMTLSIKKLYSVWCPSEHPGPFPQSSPVSLQSVLLHVLLLCQVQHFSLLKFRWSLLVHNFSLSRFF